MKIKKKWNKEKLVLTVILFIFIITFLNIGTNSDDLNDIQGENMESKAKSRMKKNKEINTNSIELTRNFFESILQEDVNSYAELGYYPTVHPPSLHATYYALYILTSIDRLNQINTAEILNYIMSHYDSASGVFSDAYSDRYLDTELEKGHPPALTSQLEVNCYALLSLSILGKLDQIDLQKMEAFLWSCQNLTEGGFIGQPVNEILKGELALPTADNTYFALQALDLLISDWSVYNLEKNKIITYLIGLQSEEEGIHLGGFKNEEDNTYNSLIIDETNLLAAFYCIKTLDLWDATFYVDSNDFKSYLEYLYNPTSDNFVIAPQSRYFSVDYYNIVATALGLDLAQFMEYSFIDTNEILTYLLNNRNEMGLWDKSTQIPYHEILYTYQIIRSLKDAGEINALNSVIRDEIAFGIQQFFFHDGFSLMSADYTSQDNLNALVNSFYNHNVNSLDSLDIPYLYSQIKNALFSIPSMEYYQMHSYTGFDGGESFYHTQPFDYKTTGTHQRIHEFNAPFNQRSMYHALDTLYKLDQLGDFEIQTGVSANNLMNMIIACQFLESGYSGTGGFSADCSNIYFENDMKNVYIYPEHAFYAIKSLELLSEYLDLGAISELSFDQSALSSYLLSYKVEDASQLYFVPSYTTYSSEILETTYQCLHVLTAMNEFALDTQKIKTYLQQYKNPDSIEAMYYTYKINKLLDFDLNINWSSWALKMKSCYSPSLHEFFNSPQDNVINPHYLSWIMEMLKDNSYSLIVNYSTSVALDSFTVINASYSNLFGDLYDGNILIELESPQLGTFILESQAGNIFTEEIFIAWCQNNYPLVSGTIRAREGEVILEEREIYIHTYPNIRIKKSINRYDSTLNIKLNVSLIKYDGATSISGTVMKAEVFRNTIIYERVRPILTHFDKYSIIEINHFCKKSGTYLYNISIEHPIEQWSEHLLERTEIFFNILSPSFFQHCNDTPPELCVEATILDLDTIWYALDGGQANYTLHQNGTIALEPWKQVNNGSTSVIVFLNDTLGNFACNTIPLIKDCSPPIFSFSQFPEQEVYGTRPPIITLTQQDEPLMDTSYQLINPLNNSQCTALISFNCSEPLNISQEEWKHFPDGEVDIALQGTDAAGNIAVQYIPINKDTTPPKITLIKPYQNLVQGYEAPKFKLFVEDLNYNRSWYYLESQNYTSDNNFLSETLDGTINSTSWQTLNDGNVTIHFKVEDSMGNIGSASSVIIKDTTIPLFKILEPHSNQKFGYTRPSFILRLNESNFKTLSVTINDHHREYYYSNDSIKSYYWSLIPDGVVILDFQVEDLAGNINSKAVSIIKDRSIDEDNNDNNISLSFLVDWEAEVPEDPGQAILQRNVIWGVIYVGNLIVFVSASIYIRTPSLIKKLAKIFLIFPPILIPLLWSGCWFPALLKYFHVIYKLITINLGISIILSIPLVIKIFAGWKNGNVNYLIKKGVEKGVSKEMVEVKAGIKELTQLASNFMKLLNNQIKKVEGN